jgi:hypothetical protein
MNSKRTLTTAMLLALGVGALGFSGCSTIPRRNPVGETFPTVTGTSLAGESVTLPGQEPRILLVGYLQEAQFDLDRWILGLLQAGAPVPILEVPTIPSRIASAFAGTIDEGMRGGIPKAEWGGVVTLYGGSGDPVAELTGTKGGRNGRILLLDAEGRVVWFHDAGYSPATLLDLLNSARALSPQAFAE